MANDIRIKRSAVEGKVPLTTDLALGELALNTYDGKLYTKKSVDGTDTVVELSSDSSEVLIAKKEITEDFTIADDENALSLIEVEVADGVEVEIGEGSTWSVLGEQFSGDYADLSGSPNSELLISSTVITEDASISSTQNAASLQTVRVQDGVKVTVAEGSKWSVLGEQFSGDYDDLSNAPTLFSGDYSDLSNAPNPVDFTVKGRSETLTAASSTGATTYNTTVGMLEFSHGSNEAFFAAYDSDAEAFLADVVALGSGDSITIDGNTVTIASSNSFPLSVFFGQLVFDTDEAGPGGWGSMVSSGSVGISAYDLSITGTSDPLFDDTYDVVIDGVTYAGGTWTVSGTSATLTGSSSDPGIATGDTLTQAPRISYTQAGTTTRLAHYSDLPASASETVEGLLSTDDFKKIKHGLNFNDTSSAANRALISTDEETYDRYAVYFQENGSYDNVILGTRLVKELSANDAENIQNTVAIGSNLLGYSAAATTQVNDFEESVIIGMKAASKFGGTLETVAIGYKALEGGSFFNNGSTNVYPHNLTGNTAVGTYAGQQLVSGMWNTCIGYSAGRFIRDATNNTFLGRNAGTSSSPSGTIQDQDNVIVLGDNSVTDLYCADTSISSSDARDKADIEDFTAGLSFIEALRPVTYKWDKRSWYVEEGSDELLIDQIPDGTHKKERLNLGFLAQEVEAVEKAHGFANDKNDRLISNLNEDETAYGVKYERLVPVLVNAIKELKAEIDDLKSQLN